MSGSGSGSAASGLPGSSRTLARIGDRWHLKGKGSSISPKTCHPSPTLASRVYSACVHAKWTGAHERDYWPEVAFGVPVSAAGATAVSGRGQNSGQPDPSPSTKVGYHARLIAWLGPQDDPQLVAVGDQLRALKGKRGWADYHPRRFTLSGAHKVLHTGLDWRRPADAALTPRTRPGVGGRCRHPLDRRQWTH
jgi:hypothetical protein